MELSTICASGCVWLVECVSKMIVAIIDVLSQSSKLLETNHKTDRKKLTIAIKIRAKKKSNAILSKAFPNLEWNKLVVRYFFCVPRIV